MFSKVAASNVINGMMWSWTTSAGVVTRQAPEVSVEAYKNSTFLFILNLITLQFKFLFMMYSTRLAREYQQHEWKNLGIAFCGDSYEVDFHMAERRNPDDAQKRGPRVFM